MSRTTLCVLTAALLAGLSIGLMSVRYYVLGDEVKVPAGPNTWRVTLVVQGHADSEARLMTATPLDFGRQHVLREVCRSAELLDRPPEPRHPERRVILWSHRGGVPAGPFRARAEFCCVTDVHHPTSSMARLEHTLYSPPRPGEYLEPEARGGDQESITDQARRLTANLDRPGDQVEALYRFVHEEIAREPSLGAQPLSAADCLRHQSGDSGAVSRLLVALLRSRAIPARLVTGLALNRGTEQQVHHWVEAWVDDHWLPMCPWYHHFGSVPSSYLVFGFGDLAVVRGRHATNVDHAFLVERIAPQEVAGTVEEAPVRRVLSALSLYLLPPTDQKLVEFLLLLPIAALIVCLFRNVIGLSSFGTFAPALVGLSFRELHSMPGFLVFVSILLIGWVLRRVLDCYHLLQVPRVAFMLSLVVVVLITAIILANFGALSATKYIALFPMIILTGMIERFWTLETEDSTTASFKTLLSTMAIAAAIALVLSLHAVVNHMFRFPETLGLIMAVQLLLGRYTGYRLTELFRFRDFLRGELPTELRCTASGHGFARQEK